MCRRLRKLKSPLKAWGGGGGGGGGGVAKIMVPFAGNLNIMIRAVEHAPPDFGEPSSVRAAEILGNLREP